MSERSIIAADAEAMERPLHSLLLTPVTEGSILDEEDITEFLTCRLDVPEVSAEFCSPR